MSIIKTELKEYLTGRIGIVIATVIMIVLSQQANIVDKLNYVDGTCIEFIKDKKINRNNTSGHKGVFLHKGGKKWSVYIMFKRKKYHLGLFEKLERYRSS